MSDSYISTLSLSVSIFLTPFEAVTPLMPRHPPVLKPDEEHGHGHWRLRGHTGFVASPIRRRLGTVVQGFDR